MIITDRQLHNAKTQAAQFHASLEALDGGSLSATDLHPLVKRAQRDAVAGQLQSLKEEISEYERLKSGEVTRFEVDALAALPDALIKARIAAGLSQRELADRLGLKEQQIQRYEANRYDGASFSRLVDVADAIGLKVRKQLELTNVAAPEALVSRLTSIGFDEGFIRRRLAPDLDLHAANAEALAERVSGVFGWSPDELRGSGALDPAQFGGATARFKMPKGRDGRAAAIYAAYAHRLAMICATAMENRPREPVPTDWRVFRQRLLDAYGEVEFRSAVSFAWDLGVVVLPLNDAGAFHGACWRAAGVNVVVLKQAARYPARWLFDLLHELRHAGEKPEAKEFEVVEGSETSEERRLSRDEKLASWFGGQVALDGKAEELVEECLGVAGNDLRRLKSALESVAARRAVSIGQLANYMAFRLSLQGENWWGSAANLQDTTYDPLVVAREVFFDRFAFEGLADADLELLTLALHEEGDHE